MKDIPVSLVELTPGQKRRRSAAIIAGGKAEFDRQEVLGRLRDIRRSSLENLGSFQRVFQQSASRCRVDSVFLAEDAAAAAAHVSNIAKGCRELAANKSATVSEMRPTLAQAGYVPADTYLPQFSKSPELTNRIERHWQLLGLPDKSVWDAFQCTRGAMLSTPEEGRQLKDLVALLGVNAAGAKDGSVFLLQHSDNIAAMLKEAKKLILVVGIEKIVADSAQALFQTRCAGLWGMESALLDLKVPADGPAGVDLSGCDAETGDSAREVHIIRLDNGRSRLMGGPFKELLYCIACRACLKRCPTYRFFGRDRGRHPKDYLWSFLGGYHPSLDLCLQCQTCRSECPLEINIPLMISKARAARANGARSLRSRVLVNAPSLAGAGKTVAPLANLALKNKLGRLALDRVIGIDWRRELPQLHRTTLGGWFRSRRPPGRGTRRIAYYAGCFASYFDVEIGRAAIGILERNGLAVSLIDNKCCGIARIAGGDIEGALRDARSLLHQLAPFAERGDDIVVSCPSCGLALKSEYPALLDDEESRLVARRTHDLSQYLLALYRNGEMDAAFQPVPLLIAYHNPCHLRAQGIESAAVDLMRLIPGLSVQTLDRGCCGMAGTFGLRSAHYLQSMEVGGPLFEELERIAPQLVVTDCAGCQMQLRCGPVKKVVHPLTVVQGAYTAGRRQKEKMK
jgi:Fe-S oxidoreductase